MYPLCCIDIRNFLNQFYFFANDDFSHPDVIDETLKEVGLKVLTGSISSRVANAYRRWTTFFRERYAIPWWSDFPRST